MTTGAGLFFRYAKPPNELGYCGPPTIGDVDELTGRSEIADAELAGLAREFHGAWPYLESIATRARLSPLSQEVVESYWIGTDLTPGVDVHDWGNSIEQRFKSRAGARWPALVGALNEGAAPDHAFHVYCVYPWVGLLKEGYVAPALDVLDNCRISRGRVVRRDGDGAVVVSSRRLAWIDDGLVETEPVDRVFHTPIGVSPGDTVSLHWGSVCQRLDRRQSSALQISHDHHLDIANRELRRSRLEPAR